MNSMTAVKLNHNLFPTEAQTISFQFRIVIDILDNYLTFINVQMNPFLILLSTHCSKNKEVIS
jgi:hypothetical protein